MMCCELIRPSATTEKQYALYLRVLSYSIYYTTTILKSYKVTNAAFYERLASNVTSLLVLYPKQNVPSAPSRHA